MSKRTNWLLVFTTVLISVSSFYCSSVVSLWLVGRVYLDRGWCYTPDTPVPAPGRSGLHTWALGYCRSSCGCGFPGCSLCCTGTRNSRTTSLRSPCGQTFYQDEAPLLMERGKKHKNTSLLCCVLVLLIISQHLDIIFYKNYNLKQKETESQE